MVLPMGWVTVYISERVCLEGLQQNRLSSSLHGKGAHFVVRRTFHREGQDSQGGAHFLRKGVSNKSIV
jgi:hypothetical protein